MEWIVWVSLWFGLGYIGSRALLLQMRDDFSDIDLDGTDYGMAWLLFFFGPFAFVCAVLFSTRVLLSMVGINIGKGNLTLSRKFWRI